MIFFVVGLARTMPLSHLGMSSSQPFRVRHFEDLHVVSAGKHWHRTIGSMEETLYVSSETPRPLH